MDYINDFRCQRYWSFPSTWNKDRKTKELNQMMFSGNYVASEKKDGYFERIVKDADGNVFMTSREKGVNGWVLKQDWVPHLHPFFEALPNNTCLIGEVFLEEGTSKNITSILGCKVEKAIERQQDPKKRLKLYLFDALQINGKDIHMLGIEERASQLLDLINSLNPNLLDDVSVAEYWTDPQEIHENWLNILAAGGEGIVMTKKGYPYSFGKRTSKMTLKVKKELEETIDVFLTGRYKDPTYLYTGKDINNWQYFYNESTQTRYNGKLEDVVDPSSYTAVTRLWYLGMAASVEIAVTRDSKVVPIGYISGIDDTLRKGIVAQPSKYAGLVGELNAMEIDRTGDVPTIRHGRIIRWRDDKTAKDCSYEQLL